LGKAPHLVGCGLYPFSAFVGNFQFGIFHGGPGVGVDHGVGCPKRVCGEARFLKTGTVAVSGRRDRRRGGGQRDGGRDGSFGVETDLFCQSRCSAAGLSRVTGD
jgi:hypothetical protein